MTPGEKEMLEMILREVSVLRKEVAEIKESLFPKSDPIEPAEKLTLKPVSEVEDFVDISDEDYDYEDLNKEKEMLEELPEIKEVGSFSMNELFDNLEFELMEPIKIKIGGPYSPSQEFIIHIFDSTIIELDESSCQFFVPDIEANKEFKRLVLKHEPDYEYGGTTLTHIEVIDNPAKTFTYDQTLLMFVPDDLDKKFLCKITGRKLYKRARVARKKAKVPPPTAITSGCTI